MGMELLDGDNPVWDMARATKVMFCECNKDGNQLRVNVNVLVRSSVSLRATLRPSSVCATRCVYLRFFSRPTSTKLRWRLFFPTKSMTELSGPEISLRLRQHNRKLVWVASTTRVEQTIPSKIDFFVFATEIAARDDSTKLFSKAETEAKSINGNFCARIQSMESFSLLSDSHIKRTDFSFLAAARS